MSANSEETDQLLKDLGLNPGISFEKVSVVFDVDFVDTSFLEVEVGAKLKLEDIQKQPDIKIPVAKDTQYVTMVMLDPDAPSRQSPSAKEWLHWLVVDIPSDGKLKDGSEKVKFAPSNPPEGSGEHRYVFLVFSQRGRIGGKKSSNIKERKGFKIHQFAKENGLKEDPKFMNFYKTEVN